MLTIRAVSPSSADTASSTAFFQAVKAMYDLSEAKSLDMFARTGELTVVNYFSEVKELHLWELIPDHKEILESRFSPASLRIGCSYQASMLVDEKYDFIVVDSPQGAHHDYDGKVHFEHFDVVEGILPKLCADECIVVLYVNKKPYDREEMGSHGYDIYSEYDFTAWMQARENFYLSSTISEAGAIAAYTFAVREWAKVESAVMVPCFSDVPGYPPYAFRLALKLKRI